VLENADGPIFVCLPTPMGRNGESDTSIVEETIRKLDEAAVALGRRAVAVIKSTVPPGTTERLNAGRKALTVCFSPEFLREATFLEDFLNQDRIVIGGPPAEAEAVADVFRRSFPNVPIVLTCSTVAEMVKYMTNCFLAVKVSLGNELKGLCDRLGIEYGRVVEIAALDERLGTSHWTVPGPDGKPGFGGSCFPKDLNALMHLAAELGALHHTLRGAWETNLAVRPERDWEQLHGRAVNYK
jgi:UDPglucose 6-dehydrogenase